MQHATLGAEGRIADLVIGGPIRCLRPRGRARRRRRVLREFMTGLGAVPQFLEGTWLPSMRQRPLSAELLLALAREESARRLNKAVATEGELAGRSGA